jgi:prolyl oligopeptidase
MYINRITLIFLLIMAGTGWMKAQEKDQFLWLEEVDGSKALQWVEEKNERSLAILTGQPDYQKFYESTLNILNSDERIAAPSIIGQYIYNFWQDGEHVRGIWRRSPKESYLTGDPDWEILIDIDKMSAEDDINWVYKGATGLYPEYNRFMVALSKGGGDAVVYREFDAVNKTFMDNGFYLPESKGGVSWLDKDNLLVFSDFGERSMTSSGYPRQVRLWKRGTSPEGSPVIFEGDTDDVSCGAYVINKPDKQYTILYRGITFYTSSYHIYKDKDIIQLEIPEDAIIVNILDDQVIIELKSDWRVNDQSFIKGSLVSADYSELINGRYKLELIVEPDERSSISSVSASKSRLLVNMLNNVRSELFSFEWNNGIWKSTKVNAPEFGAVRTGSVSNFSDDYFFWFQNFLNPTSLYYANAENNTVKQIKSLPDFFDNSKLAVRQYETESADGTVIPYFVVGHENMELNGKNPALLYAYGGFEVSMLPSYSAITGKLWLEKGGVYVLANIRGGGEFGPEWHQSGLKENRQKVFDDFHAVAEDLIDRKITSGRYLGIQGGSNGGLLVGVAFTQRPELYNAVVCQVPLLDMKRYNKLLAGASWMGEYGNPDIPDEWDFIKKYSPYHNLRHNQEYPEVFFTTSTRDDRVHPGHARKMVALMEDMGYNVYYFENTEGGHAGASTNDQRARSSALGFTYLHMKLFNNR